MSAGVALLAYAFSSGVAPDAREDGVPAVSRYDAELGWVTAPHLDLPEAFGPGASLTTNSAGFRGRAETTPTPAYPRRRVVFAGDGATLGLGVSDVEAFPALLAALEPRIESVNLAVADYGADQAFLRLLRDGLPLEPALVVLAVGARGLQRMQVERSVAAKPRLALQGASLELENQPVPPGNAPLATRVGARVLGWLGVARDPGLDGAAAAHDSALGFAPVAERALEELAGLAAREGHGLLLVYLPTAAELVEPPLPVRRWAIAAAEKLGIAFLDATPALAGGGEDVAADGALAPRGHARVAGALLPRAREELRLGDAAASAPPSPAEVP